LNTHRFHVWTIGCQMNVAESTAITLALRKHGLSAVASMDDADLVILNSCTVRESAEQRVQGQLSLLAARKRRDPDLMVALTGCSVEPDLAAMEQKLPMVDFFSVPARSTISSASSRPRRWSACRWSTTP